MLNIETEYVQLNFCVSVGEILSFLFCMQKKKKFLLNWANRKKKNNQME